MAKYIDADALKNNLISSGAICDFGQYLIDIQPAADVRPERHGHWEWSILLDGYYDYKCSVCGAREVTTTTPHFWNNDGYHVYCGVCGAKMDGKDV